jgi:anti-sigma factor (TIGR02949 family)
MSQNRKSHASNDIGCLEAIEALYTYLDGELTDPEALAKFEHHLGHCRSCFSRTEMEKALSERIRKTAHQESPELFRWRVKSLLEKF